MGARGRRATWPLNTAGGTAARERERRRRRAGGMDAMPPTPPMAMSPMPGGGGMDMGGMSMYFTTSLDGLHILFKARVRCALAHMP